MMSDKFFVYTALVCRACGKEIYGIYTLRDTVSRRALSVGARKNGGVRSKTEWFCSKACRAEFSLNPGMGKATKCIPKLP